MSHGSDGTRNVAFGVSQIFQFDLQKLGIKANIKPYEPAGYLDQINNHKYTGTYVGSTAYASMLPSTRMANSRHLDPSGNSNTGYKSDAYTDLYTKLSTEPSDVARLNTFTRAVNAFAASSPPAKRSDIIPPNPPRICAAATAWFGCVGRPG